MRTLTITLLLVVALQAAKAQNTSKGYNLDLFYSHVLTAKMNTMLMMLDTIPEQKMSPAQIALKKKYFERFRTRSEVFTFHTADPDVQHILHMYYNYWQEVLCRRQPFDKAKTALKDTLSHFIYKRYYQNRQTSRDSLFTNLHIYLSDYLEKEKHIESVLNFESTIADVYLWQKQSVKNYKVRLPEGTTKAKVIFMEDVITLGWNDFASFGKITTGGFVATTGIFCLPKSDRYDGYDLKSETFKVSYLKHEVQHFLDVDLFPNLSFADKEYRAKLIELYYARKTAYHLLKQFTLEADSTNRSYAHPYADYVLIRNFSKKLLNKNYESDYSRWSGLTVGKINETALILLKENTKALLMRGKQVQDYVFNTPLTDRRVKDRYSVNGKVNLLLVPIGAKNPTVFQRKYPLDNATYTHNLADFYAKP